MCFPKANVNIPYIEIILLRNLSRKEIYGFPK